MNRLEQLVQIASMAVNNDGPGPLSVGEALAASLVLNRSDWLKNLGYSIAEALARVEDDWIALIPQAAKIVATASYATARAGEVARQESELNAISAGDQQVDVNAELITYGNAPGYRGVHLVFDLERVGREPSKKKHRVSLNINAKDGAAIVDHIVECHRFAWRRVDIDDNGTPLDLVPGEKPPRWIKQL